MIIDMEKIIEKYLNNEYDHQTNTKIIKIIDKILNENSHFIKIKPIHYAKLCEKKLSINSKEILLNMASHYTTKTSVVKKIASKLIVTENEFIKENGIFKIPFDKLDDYHLSSNHILGENLIDCKIYCELTNLYIKNKNFGGVKLNLEEENGGGSTIGKIYEDLCLKKKIVISITDSDKKYPSDTCGKTAEGLETIKKNLFKNYKNEIFLENIFSLNVRELENLIPLEIFEILFDHDEGTIFDVLKNIKNFENIYKFIDLKKGLKVKDLKNRDFFKEWKPILENINFKNINFNISNSPQEKLEQLDNILKSSEEKKVKTKCLEILENQIQKEVRYDSLKKLIEDLDNINDNCLICSGYNTKILDKFFNFLKNPEKLIKKTITDKNKEEKIENLKNSYSYILKNEEIEQISNEILTWGCCYDNGIKSKKIIANLN